MPDNTQNLHKKGLGLPHTIRLNSGQRMNQGRAQGCVSCFRHAVWQNSEAEHARHRPESERGKSCEFSATSCGWCWSAGGWRSAIWEPACSTASPLSVFRSDCNRSRWPSLRSGHSERKSPTCRFQIPQSRQGRIIKHTLCCSSQSLQNNVMTKAREDDFSGLIRAAPQSLVATAPLKEGSQRNTYFEMLNLNSASYRSSSSCLAADIQSHRRGA